MNNPYFINFATINFLNYDSCQTPAIIVPPYTTAKDALIYAGIDIEQEIVNDNFSKYLAFDKNFKFIDGILNNIGTFVNNKVPRDKCYKLVRPNFDSPIGLSNIPMTSTDTIETDYNYIAVDTPWYFDYERVKSNGGYFRWVRNGDIKEWLPFNSNLSLIDWRNQKYRKGETEQGDKFEFVVPFKTTCKLQLNLSDTDKIIKAIFNSSQTALQFAYNSHDSLASDNEYIACQNDTGLKISKYLAACLAKGIHKIELLYDGEIIATSENETITWESGYYQPKDAILEIEMRIYSEICSHYIIFTSSSTTNSTSYSITYNGETLDSFGSFVAYTGDIETRFYNKPQTDLSIFPAITFSWRTPSSRIIKISIPNKISILGYKLSGSLVSNNLITFDSNSYVTSVLTFIANRQYGDIPQGTHTLALPIRFFNPQFSQEEKRYTDMVGRSIQLTSQYIIEYEAETDYIPYSWHEKIMQWLLCDRIEVYGGEAFSKRSTEIYKSESYQINWEDVTETECGEKFVRATFKVKVQTNKRNSIGI